MSLHKTIITGTGSFIPTTIKTNKEFAVTNFYDESFIKIPTHPAIIAEKFRQITGIEERRYVDADMQSSDMASIAARRAIEDAGCDSETLDQIIVAHNFGNTIKHTIQTDAVPALAARVKHNLKIKNVNCVAYDILFGCPGWLQAVIQADAYFKAGIAKKMFSNRHRNFISCY